MSVCAALKGHLASLSLSRLYRHKKVWNLKVEFYHHHPAPGSSVPALRIRFPSRIDATLTCWYFSVNFIHIIDLTVPRNCLFIAEKIMNVFFEACVAQSPNQTEEGEMLPLMGSALRVGTSMHCKWRLMLIAVQKISYFLGSWRSACPKQLRKTSHLTWSLTDSICIYIPNTTWGHQPSFKLVGAQTPS